MSKAQTIGQRLVGTSFNPSGREDVNHVKQNTADLIDSLIAVRDMGGDAGRCAAIAMTKYEEAAMWAVKALTKPQQGEPQ